VQRLAHAHEDDVEGAAGERGVLHQHPDLARNFAGGEVAHETHLAGEAERAIHRTTDLRRDAERLGRRVRNEDRLDFTTVGELDQVLRRAV
jgi:hypothetical protein